MAGYLDRLFWNQYARSYDNLAKHFRPYQDLVTEVCDHVDSIGERRSLRVLDAGCGTGNYSWELARRGHEVVGIDNSPSMLARAKARNDADRPPTFKVQDLTRPLEFQDNEFDAAVCVHVFYTLPDPHVLAGQVSRVVREGGALVAVTLQSPVTIGGSLKEAYREGGLTLAAKTFRALFGVGACNLVIRVRQKSGSYHNMDRSVFCDFLLAHAMRPRHVTTTYTCGISVLAIAEVGL